MGFLPGGDGLVKATKLNKGYPQRGKRPVQQRIYWAHANGTFKAPDRFLRLPQEDRPSLWRSMREMNWD